WRRAGFSPARPASGFLLRVGALAASVVLMGVGLGFLSVRDSKTIPAAFQPDPARGLAEARASLDALMPALDRLDRGFPDLFAAPEDSTGWTAVQGGDPFRVMRDLPGRWEDIYRFSDSFPLNAVLWDQSSRAAWTAGAEPLPAWDDSLQRDGQGVGRRSLVDSRGRWFLREVGTVPGGFGLEIQIALDPQAASGYQPGILFEVLEPGASFPAGDRGNGPGADAVVVKSLPDRVLVLTALDDGLSGGSVRWRSRLLLSGLLAWVLILAAGTRLAAGPMVFLAVLWVGRAMLAASELLRWITLSFPGQVFPAHPGSLFSLVDPAYFATPFAFGWFASVADALLTSLLVAVTAWRLLQLLGVVQGGGLSRLRSPLRKQGLLQGALFGVVVGLVLLWLQFFAGLLAQNANARLIGTGVSLSFLSFWGLQISLMLMAFGLAALVTGLLARTSWPRRGEMTGWVGGALVAGGVATLVHLILGEGWWAGRLLVAVVAVVLWVLAPALLARPHFLRRFAWPAILLITVVWNYGSLRAVYDQAERSWLERKGAVITQADPEWTRILLSSVLEEMAAQEAAAGTPTVARSDVWRDEAAWALWRDSALRDLGYSCLVEIVDEDAGEESLFTQGFLRDFQYEVVSRSAWVGINGLPVQDNWDMIFQTERRIYAGGQEEVVAAEIARTDGGGWIRVELPVRSWRISTLIRELWSSHDLRSNGYRPRAEVDRPILLLRADDTGWLEADALGFPGPAANPFVADLRAGLKPLAVIPRAGRSWLCRWNPLPPGAARAGGEGFLLGLQRSNFREDLLDLSRLMLLNLVLLFTLFGFIQLNRWATRGRLAGDEIPWRPGFQERFLAGYLFLGLVLLLVVGTSVDKVGHDRVRSEARAQTRAGLALAVEQLRNLLVEQARSLAASEYIFDLLEGQLAGTRPVGPVQKRQGMVFGPDGTLLLDETLSDLDDDQARALLNAGREAPLVVIRDEDEYFVGTVIPLDLGEFFTAPEDADDLGHSDSGSQGFFFYRQALDAGLLGSLADLVDGQAMLRFDGLPVFASQSGAVFSGEAPLLAEPAAMAAMLDHPSGQGVFAAPGRPFAFTGAQPLPAFGPDDQGELRARRLPAILALNFPDREREYIGQRRGTVLFLTGLANLILLTALVLALLMSWNIFRPLRLLLTATRSLAQGDFEAPLPDPGSDEIGRLAGAFSLMRDDLQSARDDLAARERFLATVLNRVTVGVAVLDNQGEIVTLNPAGRQILAGFGGADGDQTDVSRLLAGFRTLAAGEDRVGGELASEDGRRTLRGAMAPLDLPGGRTDTMLVFEDITEFLDHKKMAINAELARQVAHEIKNPLTPIQLSVQLLGQAWQDKHPNLDRIVAETVDRVLNQVTLLRSIAGEFSLLGRPGELETEAVDLEALVVDVLAGYGAGDGARATGGETAAAAGIAVPAVELEPGPVPAVLAHRDSLQKILGNLMQNSLDATRPGQPLSIGISWRRETDHLTLVWADNGAGLPAEVADRLFDPYFSTKSKGTGLGLAICRNLADRMGGTIRLYNRSDGPGAIAELSLPLGCPDGSQERDSGNQ
ncbi:MAG: ATP-binding protein, partial [Candidatus Krumholzibacteriota bacterium]